jgi:hypothetical protein
MYDAVVGHSYVPDMVQGIGDEFEKLGGLMVEPAGAATATTAGHFSDLQAAVGDVAKRFSASIGNMAGELGGARFGGAVTDFLNRVSGPGGIAEAAKGFADRLIGQEGITDALGKLVGALSGTGFGSAVRSFVETLLGTAAAGGIKAAIAAVMGWVNDLINAFTRLHSAMSSVGGISVGTGGLGGGAGSAPSARPSTSPPPPHRVVGTARARSRSSTSCA